MLHTHPPDRHDVRLGSAESSSPSSSKTGCLPVTCDALHVSFRFLRLADAVEDSPVLVWDYSSRFIIQYASHAQVGLGTHADNVREFCYLSACDMQAIALTGCRRMGCGFNANPKHPDRKSADVSLRLPSFDSFPGLSCLGVLLE